MPDKIFGKIKDNYRRITEDKNTKFAFFCSVILMLAAHGFCFTNLMYSHDSLNFAGYGEDKIPLGRWLYPVFVHLRHAANPYLIGLVATLFIAASVVVTVWIFDFDRPKAFAVAVLYTTNITLTSLYQTYIYDADADGFAILAACLAVYFAVKVKGLWGRIFSVLCLVLSLATYQTYFCVTACIFLTVYLLKASQITDGAGVKEWIISALKDIATMLASFAVYLGTMKISLLVTGMEMGSDYNSPSNAAGIGIDTVLGFFPLVWENFRNQFYLDVNGNDLLWLNRIITLIIIVEAAALLVVLRKRLYAFLLILLCGVLMLYASYGFLLMSGGVIHHLMIFATNFLYLLCLVLAGILVKCQFKAAAAKAIALLPGLCIFLIACLGWHNICFANNTYMVKKLVYDNTALHAQTVWEDIQNTEGYEDDTQVVFMGKFEKSKAQYKNAKTIINEKQSIGFTRSAITYDETVELYFYYILGRKMDITENDEELKNNPEVQAMPCYPKDGYIKMIDGRLVVKMSEIK